MNSLTIKDEALLKMYSESVEVGTEDMGEQGKFPMVKITAGLSKDNILANGKRSEIGKLYHTELKQDFDSIKANICYVGQYELPDFKPPHDLKRTYVFGAVMQADNTPFVMYVKGMSLQKVWDFQSEVHSMRTRYSVPMFALSVEIGVTQRVSEKFGEVDVFNFSILRDKNGMPLVETNIERAESLKKLVPVFKETIQKMNNTTESEDEYSREMNGERESVDYIADEVVDVEDISEQVPF